MLKRRVQNLLTVCEGGNALEIGAGCLRNSIYLQSVGFRVTALDVPAIEERFPEQYQRFRQKGGRVVFKKLSERGRYHFAVCTFVIESICRPSERLDLLSAVCHALRPHGFLVISTRGPEDVVTARADGVRCSDGYITPNKSFARSFTREQLGGLLLAAGFVDIEFLHKQKSRAPELLHAVAFRNKK